MPLQCIEGPGPNWFQLSYTTSSLLPPKPVQATNVKFMDPTTNALYTVLQSEIGASKNEYQVQVPNCTNVNIEWPAPSGITYAGTTNTQSGYTESSPDSVTLS